jgi:AcrR family transcriptional regulator
MGQIGENPTRERILDVAERLFADSGFEATSLRQITTDADVNLAAVNYHFGSKDGLVRQVLTRRIGQVNEQRLTMLERIEADGGPDGPKVEQIVEAFVGPPLRMAADQQGAGHVFMRLLGHAHAHPDHELTDFVVDQFRDVAIRFAGAFHRALPELDKTDVFWRMLFMIGAMAHSLAMGDHLPKVSSGMCEPQDTAGILRRIVPFLAAGFRADGAAEEAS